MVERFSERRLFLDVDELGSGRFDDRLLEIIENTPCFILVLSPGSLDRCVHPDDWLRREILHALACNMNLVPVLVDGFAFPPSSFFARLPSSLAVLPNYQAVVYDHQYADSAVRKILRYMTAPVSVSGPLVDRTTGGSPPQTIGPRATAPGAGEKPPAAEEKTPAAAASEAVASGRVTESPTADPPPGSTHSGLGQGPPPTKGRREASSLPVRTSAAADASVLGLSVPRPTALAPSRGARSMLGRANLSVLGSGEENRASRAGPPSLPRQLPSLGSSSLTVTARRAGEAGRCAPPTRAGLPPRFLGASLGLTSRR